MRDFGTTFTLDQIESMQRGVMAYTYKGIPCLKCPFDMAIYTRLLWDVKPQSLIEIGTSSGGSALWLADMMTVSGLDTKIISIDIEAITKISDPRIEFIKGDVHDLDAVLTPDIIAAMPRPLLVIEDSAHTYQSTYAALKFFSEILRAGEVMVVEDGIVDAMGISQAYDGGPNRAIAEFMETSPESFSLMTELCDYYGRNATYNPNGYLKKL